MARTEEVLMADILARYDQDGNLREMVAGFEALTGNPIGRLILNLTPVKVPQVKDLLNQQRRLLVSSARSLLLFAPRGWAPCGLTPQSMLDKALEVYDRTGSIEDSETVLVEGWNESPLSLRFCETRLRGLGMADEELGRLCRARADLVEKALTHHQSGAYEASVPIVLAQIDGLVRDTTEGAHGFFSGLGDRSHLRDSTTLPGVDEGLDALQKYFGARQDVSSSTGGASRHGILHGRELGYDTKMNSTKALVLLLAVIEWAAPRAKEIAERRRTEREAKWAGSEEVDERGRRMDRRGFSEMRSELRMIHTRQIAEYRRHNRYPEDLRRLFTPGTTHGDSIAAKGIVLEVTDDGQEFMTWGHTVSGWVLGVAGKGGSPMDHLYAGPDRPPGNIESGCWDMDTPPDWRGMD
jgi:hypothetical protein